MFGPWSLGFGLFAFVASFVLIYPENPPVAHTGGFGEPTCHACHFDGELNDGEGSLSLKGLYSSYAPGERYPVRVILERPGMLRGGFQLAVRSEKGVQAGTLIADDERVAIDAAGGVQYIRHTPEGTRGVVGDSMVWQFDWLAPDRPVPVVFHLSANAANDDESEFGDAIYQTEQAVDPE